MSVFVFLEAQVKPEVVGEYKSFMEDILPDTRAFSGCKSVVLDINEDDATNFLLVEEWDSREDHQKYMAWRTETGMIDRIISMLAAPPSLRYFGSTTA